jgi:hypothetical protein
MLPDNRTKRQKNIHRLPEVAGAMFPCLGATGETKKPKKEIGVGYYII